MSRVSVATYPTRAQAEMVAQMLAEAGLDADVVGEDAGGALPHLAMGIGGPTVRVSADQERAAAELLDVDLRDHSQPPADPVYERLAGRRRRRLRIIGAVVLAVIVLIIVFSIAASGHF